MSDFVKMLPPSIRILPPRKSTAPKEDPIEQWLRYQLPAPKTINIRLASRDCDVVRELHGKNGKRVTKKYAYPVVAADGSVGVWLCPPSIHKQIVEKLTKPPRKWYHRVWDRIRSLLVKIRILKPLPEPEENLDFLITQNQKFGGNVYTVEKVR